MRSSDCTFVSESTLSSTTVVCSAGDRADVNAASGGREGGRAGDGRGQGARLDGLGVAQGRGDRGQQHRRVVVAFVDRHPGDGLRLARGPLGEQRRLAVAGRGDDGDDRLVVRAGAARRRAPCAATWPVRRRRRSQLGREHRGASRRPMTGRGQVGGCRRIVARRTVGRTHLAPSTGSLADRRASRSGAGSPAGHRALVRSGRCDGSSARDRQWARATHRGERTRPVTGMR